MSEHFDPRGTDDGLPHRVPAGLDAAGRRLRRGLGDGVGRGQEPAPLAVPVAAPTIQPTNRPYAEPAWAALSAPMNVGLAMMNAVRKAASADAKIRADQPRRKPPAPPETALLT